MSITHYSIKQWLMAIWVLFDEWRKTTPKRERIKQIAVFTFYALMTVVFLVSLGFWWVFLSGFSY